MHQFYPLTVAEVRPETRDAVVVTFTVPDPHEAVFRYIQGQYLTLRATIDGEEIRRSYSICSGVRENRLRVGIKRVPGGVFSNWAADRLKPGDVIESMPPAGSFHTQLDPGARRHYVAFVGGSGITPVLGVMKTVLETEPESIFTLFYGNMASGSIMFREELEDLKNQHLDRVQLVHVLEREQQDIELFNGILNRNKCAMLLKYWVDAADIDTAFICGPEAMMLQASEALEEAGVDRRSIKFELFANASQPKRRSAAKHVARTQPDCQATIIIDGRQRRIDMHKERQSILDAGLAEGIELPFACKGGVCSTCRALLREGEVEMDANFALEDYEVERGYILCCQSYPVTDRVVVDFDQ
ncbi:MAG: phenylacetate-CoA oxygenase/reductase subunit PaaK [Proteobacteria bacterium]|nr:MAG: phenylacetate-CoA oxygenase/reductase subunit PaaK [Pseudomonadota bacterium]